MGSTILYLLVLCLCFHSTVSFNETFKLFQYQDILRHVAQIGHFDYQQHISANLQKVEVVKNLFYDPELNSQNSKAFTPWKLLHDGAQTWKSFKQHYLEFERRMYRRNPADSSGIKTENSVGYSE